MRDCIYYNLRIKKMRSPISKHWSGKGYNSPIKQVNAQTKLKDVPRELVNSGKKIVKGVTNAASNVADKAINYGKQIGNKIGNTTVGEAINVAGVAYGMPPGTLIPKEKKMSATKTKLQPQLLRKDFERLKK